MKLKRVLFSIFLVARLLVFSACKKETKSEASTGTCSDGVKNQDESEVDCGGVCSKCITCSDGIKNQGETDIDCGGPCSPCPIIYPEPGIYGKNIIGKKNDETLAIGYYSLSARIPAGAKVKIRMTDANGGNLNYGYVPANTNFQVVNEQGLKAQSFIGVGPLSADANIVFGDGPIFPKTGTVKIEVFENDATSATWTKFISW